MPHFTAVPSRRRAGRTAAEASPDVEDMIAPADRAGPEPERCRD